MVFSPSPILFHELLISKFQEIRKHQRISGVSSSTASRTSQRRIYAGTSSPANWPAMPMLEEIINKSSGQSIYASVVANYVSSPRGNPAHLLEIVRGIRPQDPSSHIRKCRLEPLLRPARQHSHRPRGGSLSNCLLIAFEIVLSERAPSDRQFHSAPTNCPATTYKDLIQTRTRENSSLEGCRRAGLRRRALKGRTGRCLRD
jgi:hypothetical protein